MNNSARSIFTDIRYTSRYGQDAASPNRPQFRRSYSESAREPRSPGFVQDSPLERIPPLQKASTTSASSGHIEDLGNGTNSPKKVRAESSRDPRLKRPTQASKKRTAEESHSKGLGIEPSRKRRHYDDRVQARRATQAFPQSPSGRYSLPSPLFFSNSPDQRPQLPPRFSSSEAGAKMLSKAQGEDKTVKTVTLARGSFASATSPTTPSRPGLRTRYSSGRNSLSRTESRSPDTLDRHDPSYLLGSIGLLELLEHDSRPTFVVDVSDTKNFHSDGLHIFYANPAFLQKSTSRDRNVKRSSRPIELGTCFENLLAVKTWIYGRVQFGDTNPKYTPVLVDGETLWSCTFLRRRICVVSGAPYANPTVSSQMPVSLPTRSPSITLNPTASDQAASAPDSSPPASNAVSPKTESQDYFNTIVEPTEPAPAQSNVPVPSIERNESSTSSIVADNAPIERPTHSPLANIPDRFPAEHVLSAACAGNVDLNASSSGKEIGFFDWTRLPVSDALPKHIQFARSVDWGKTSLGPIETWSADLRQMCNLIMASPHPAAMYWGTDLVAIYNEAYVLLAGQKHPALMGQSYRDAWAEIWDEVKDVFASAQTTGQATMKDDDCLFIRRNDFLEETYFSWSIIPMVGGDGSVMGLYNPAFEKTRRKIAERRMLTLREIGERTAAARDVKSFWEEVLGAMECNEFDTPFVLLYSLHGENDSHEDSSVHSSNATGFSTQKQCCLEGALGVPPDHPAAPISADLNGDEGYVSIFREVQKTNKPIVLDVARGEISAALLEGLEVRGFNDPVQSVVVCPIHPTTGDSTLGFLVLGVNPRRPFDEDYTLFVQLLGRQLATSLASVVLFEEEIKRGQQAAKLAALDRMELSEQLAARTQEAIDSETKFTRMAEFVPVGVFIAASNGIITYCNESWHAITHIPKDNKERWMEYVRVEHQEDVRSLWHELVIDKRSVSAEFRFNAPWTDRNGVQGDMWVLFSAYPERYEDGGLKSVFGSITNISSQKWAEGLQKRKMEEAVELKRQQENFIDITSHEMRNPLSAILQCADEIVISLGEKKQSSESKDDVTLYDNNIDAAHTIVLCAQHQKRIVDDILTLSKLDSALLMVTPVDVQPVTVAQRALKMFENEVQSAGIEMRFKVDASISDLNVDWCKFDPSRVLQVLINLTTNAIKFTTSESRRIISISLAASKTKFSDSINPVVSYFPNRSKRSNGVDGVDWGSGEEMYIQFAVQDTGRGLSAEEKKLLFLRFSQASPRTHVQYGGSGLGLFISRELTELQGGEIGVASEAGKGSTFAFFIRARKTTPPTKPLEKALGMTGRSTPSARTGDRTSPSDKMTPTPKSNREPTRAGGPLRVLIVEDNLVNQKVLQKQLRNMGCDTQVANHGGEALDRLKQSWFWADRKSNALALDVVLMDQEMPVMDGLTCTRKIRELENEGKFARHVPVIAVTANARVEQIETAKDAGMDDVVSKPFRIQELIPKMEELTNQYPPPI